MSTTPTNGFHGSERFWANTVKRLYVPAIRYFTKALPERLLPPFKNLKAEAEQCAEEEYQRLGNCASNGANDGAELAKMAEDEAINWYMSMMAVRQSVINLHAVGLRHLFEQQVFDLVYYVPLASRTKADFEEDMKAIRDNGVEIEHFQSWLILEELRHVCNAVKHAEGNSAATLKTLRPDLFIHPAVAGLPFLNRPGRVSQPLAGKDIYLCEAEIEKYAQAIVDFWGEFSQILERLA